MAKIKVIDNFIFYDDVKVGCVFSDTTFAADFRDFLNFTADKAFDFYRTKERVKRITASLRSSLDDFSDNLDRLEVLEWEK